MSLELLTKAIEDHGKAVQETKQDLSNQVNTLAAQITEIELKMGRRGGPASGRGHGNGGSPIESFVQSEQLKMMHKGASSTGRVQLQGGDLPTLRKALTSSSVDVPAQRAGGLYNNPQPTLSFLDLLPVVPVTAGTFEFMSLTAAANGAALQVNEGDLKAESTPAFAVQRADIVTIAHWVRASNQVLADAPALERQLGDLMTYGVEAKLETEVLKGDGTTGHMLGLLKQATPFLPANPATTQAADRIGQAITSLGAIGWVARAVLMNHTDWFAIASMKDADSNYIMGSPRNPGPLSLWGVPVVLSAAMTAGTALVLDTAQVALLDREQATVMASRDDRDNFVTNQTTLLAELRAGLAVFAPGAVLSVPLAS
ncbi:phage major capsid protein [Pseudomonas oryzihabitans]|uniref:phage major capsid protein n=1 Tax=Pseudomonas oryzihabitans TaxID=47885 RepID=UPI00289F1AF2|nr:phage major capsid protein [Pseudomonas oryzihabitans]